MSNLFSTSHWPFFLDQLVGLFPERAQSNLKTNYEKPELHVTERLVQLFHTIYSYRSVAGSNPVRHL